MKESEAIKEIETSIELAKMCTQNFERTKEIEAYAMAIKALEEVQQYRAIGTPEECRAAVEKQKAKKMVIKNDNGRPRRACGGCGCFVLPASRFCSKCGQKLDWSDEE